MMQGNCAQCGKPKDDALIVLGCGCTRIGHSGSSAVRAILEFNRRGTVECPEHGHQEITTVAVTNSAHRP